MQNLDTVKSKSLNIENLVTTGRKSVFIPFFIPTREGMKENPTSN